MSKHIEARLTLLEHELTEMKNLLIHNDTFLKLQSRVEQLGKLVEDSLEIKIENKEVEKTPNELRVDIIEKAKQFIQDQFKPRNDGKLHGYVADGKDCSKICDLEFIVNEEKRTVVALLKWQYNNKVYHRGIAKCMDSDVFNQHIGCAIALGRALGLNVSEFEQAVQPTEVVAGMVAKCLDNFDVEYSSTVLAGRSFYIHCEDCLRRRPDKLVAIINDTDAQY